MLEMRDYDPKTERIFVHRLKGRIPASTTWYAKRLERAALG